MKCQGRDDQFAQRCKNNLLIIHEKEHSIFAVFHSIVSYLWHGSIFHGDIHLNSDFTSTHGVKSPLLADRISLRDFSKTYWTLQKVFGKKNVSIHHDSLPTQLLSRRRHRDVSATSGDSSCHQVAKLVSRLVREAFDTLAVLAIAQLTLFTFTLAKPVLWLVIGPSDQPIKP